MALLLTVDVGNTNIKLAAFDGDRELTSKSYDTNHGDYEAVMKDFADEKKLDKEIEAAMVSCVVPRIKPLIVLAIKMVFNIEPLMVEDYAAIKIATVSPEEVGSDLIAMAEYGYHLTHKATIILSFGTANVICYVDKEGVFRYCIIGPGLRLQVNSLFENAAKLPPFRLYKQADVLANTTVASMNVGVIDGTIGATKYLLKELVNALDLKDYKVIAAGGLGHYVVPYIAEVDEFIPEMVTSALRYIYYRGEKNA